MCICVYDRGKGLIGKGREMYRDRERKIEADKGGKEKEKASEKTHTPHHHK